MNTSDIKERCRHLRARAPQEWADFVTMFAEHTAESIDALTEAPAEEIMTLKGFARAHKAWLKTFNALDDPPPLQPKPLTPYTP